MESPAQVQGKVLATLSDRASVAPPKRAEQGRPSKNAPYEKLHISVSSPADYPFIFAVLKKNEPRPLVHPLLDFLILFLACFSESPFSCLDRSILPPFLLLHLLFFALTPILLPQDTRSSLFSSPLQSRCFSAGVSSSRFSTQMF